MKNLWMQLPPLLSDHYGLIETIKGSDGCAIVDDSGELRPGGGHGRGSWQGGRGGYGGERGYGGKGGGRGGKGGSTRVVVSGASDQDVTTGTREILMQAFQQARSRFDPSFALFSAGPCGAMIGTDLQEIADAVSKEYHIPAAAVELTGQKTYDVGLSKAAEAMARLLAKPGEREPGAVNILGANALDWSESDLAELKSWAGRQGLHILAQPGGTITHAQLESMGKARLNLVVTVSGLAAARYLHSQFGTPFVAAAPFGAAACARIIRAAEGGGGPEQTEPAKADALIIGEQFTANAVRDAMEAAGVIKGADVMSFFLLDKANARSGDRRLRGEADAKEVLNSGTYRLIVADPLLRPLLQGGCKWVDLPHKALNTYHETDGVSLFDSGLEHWLNQQSV